MLLVLLTWNLIRIILINFRWLFEYFLKTKACNTWLCFVQKFVGLWASYKCLKDGDITSSDETETDNMYIPQFLCFSHLRGYKVELKNCRLHIFYSSSASLKIDCSPTTNARLLFVFCVVVYVEQVTCSVPSVIACFEL